MNVPFLDLSSLHEPLWPQLHAAIDGVLRRNEFVLGPAVERFEANFAKYVDARFAVGVNNGTSALQLALQACDVGAGDEVITTPHSWISTTWAISYVGATPVFVDIDPVTYTLDVDQVRQATTKRTKAILPVHLYGQAADLTALTELADQAQLVLIEDAAQAHGARHGGRRVGSFGKVGCFSFYPGKNLGALGEAGAVTTNDKQVAARIRRLRDHAQHQRHVHVELGYNARMEGLQGAALDVKLAHLDGWNEQRRRHANRYRELLAGIPEIVLPESRLPLGHVWHLYVVLARDCDREALRSQLQSDGVATGVHYPTLIPFQEVYAGLGYRHGDFPVAEAVADSCLSLPMYPGLSDEQLIYVAERLRCRVRSAARGDLVA